jgi:hypothetical protein
MSLSNKKILVSGCGLSWGSQERKTWVNILKIGGASIIDAGGPAVSNQWIINQSILQAMSNTDITHVVIQLTSIGKLDVETNPDRIAELVESDQLRNFTFNGIWPSSHSTNHPAKQLWKTWLSSPGLELQDIFCKLVLPKPTNLPAVNSVVKSAPEKPKFSNPKLAFLSTLSRLNVPICNLRRPYRLPF